MTTNQTNSNDHPKNRFLHSVDQRIRSIFVGLSPQEIRAILRGDPPTEKPNPRYKAQVTSFLLHIRPRYYQNASTWFTHTFRLGFLTTFLFIVEVITGLILMVYYVPTPEGAYASIFRIMSEVPYGEILRDVHRLAAEAMVIVAFLHMLRTYLTGSFKKERTFTWMTGVLLLILTLALAFSGYLLPWDQLAYWAVTIGTSMAEATPWIGEQLVILLRGSVEIGADGLLRFYLLHIVFLPILLAGLLSIHYYRVVRHHGLSIPAAIEEGEVPEKVRQDATRRINLIPDILIHELMLVSVLLLALIAAAYLFYDAPLESHANPSRTPLGTEAPWFFLWVQGLLKLGDKTLMGVLIPVGVFAILFALPYLDLNPSRRLKKRPFALIITLLALVVLVVLSYMGTAEYGITMPAAVRISDQLAPEEGPGPLKLVPYDELTPGVYLTNQTDPATLSPGLSNVFLEYEQLVNEAQSTSELPEAQGILVIEERQQNLKKLTLRISWFDAEAEKRRTNEHNLYIHRDHYSPELGVVSEQVTEQNVLAGE